MVYLLVYTAQSEKQVYFICLENNGPFSLRISSHLLIFCKERFEFLLWKIVMEFSPPSLTSALRKARSFWRRWTNIETVFSIFYVLLRLWTLNYTKLYMPCHLRAHIYCLLCQKFPIAAAAANLFCPLFFVIDIPSLQWSSLFSTQFS